MIHQTILLISIVGVVQMNQHRNELVDIYYIGFGIDTLGPITKEYMLASRKPTASVDKILANKILCAIKHPSSGPMRFDGNRVRLRVDLADGYFLVDEDGVGIDEKGTLYKTNYQELKLLLSRFE